MIDLQGNFRLFYLPLVGISPMKAWSYLVIINLFQSGFCSPKNLQSYLHSVLATILDPLFLLEK